MPYIPGKKPPKVEKSKCEKYLVFKLNNNSNQRNISYQDNSSSVPPADAEKEDEKINESIEVSEKQAVEVSPNEEKIDRDKYCGDLLMEDYKNSQAQYPGSVFAISVNAKSKLDFFTHKPYEKYWNIEKTCKIANELGCKSIELVEPEHWPTLKKYNLVCALHGSHWFDKGMNNPSYHDMCIQKIRDSIDICAEYGFPNVITAISSFSITHP